MTAKSLVQRLNERPYDSLLHEAADEIERLQLACVKWRDSCTCDAACGASAETPAVQTKEPPHCPTCGCEHWTADTREPVHTHEFNLISSTGMRQCWCGYWEHK